MTFRQLVGVANAAITHAEFFRHADRCAVWRVDYRDDLRQLHDLESVFHQAARHLRSQATVPVVLPDPPTDFEDAGLFQRLDAAHADASTGLLEHRGAHAATVLSEIPWLAREPGVNAGLLPGLAVTHIAHHLGIGHEAFERRPVGRFPGANPQTFGLDAETH